jgi:hypothetical protein
VKLPIQPIKLLSGSHADTGQTGQGCFMNVIAYLNGEAQITDASTCVCVTVRPIAVWLNDYLKDDERHLLLPFIERAMGSATKDREVMNRRLRLVVELATAAAHAAANATNAATNDAANAAYVAANAAYVAANAADAAINAAYAAINAAYAASRAIECTASRAIECTASRAIEYVKARRELITLGFDFLNAALPPAQAPEAPVLVRANALVRLNAVT